MIILGAELPYFYAISLYFLVCLKFVIGPLKESLRERIGKVTLIYKAAVIEVRHLCPIKVGHLSNCKAMIFKCFHPGGISLPTSHFSLPFPQHE